MSSLCNACHHHLLLIILLLFLLLKHLHFHFILYHLSTPPFFSHFVLLFSVSPLRRTPSSGGSRNHSLPHQLPKSRRTSGILRSREWHKSAGRGKLVYYCLLLFVPLRRADETLKHARIRTNAYDCAAPLIHDYFSLLFFFFFVSTRRRTKRNCRCRARRAVLCWIISLIQATEEETGRAAAAVFFLLLFSDVLERASPRLGVPLMRIDERILFSSLLSFVFLSCLHLFS